MEDKIKEDLESNQLTQVAQVTQPDSQGLTTPPQDQPREPQQPAPPEEEAKTVSPPIPKKSAPPVPNGNSMAARWPFVFLTLLLLIFLALIISFWNEIPYRLIFIFMEIIIIGVLLWFFVKSLPAHTPSREGLPNSYNLPERNPDFTGHEKTLARLKQELASSPNAKVFLSGLSGVGKTEVAKEYAYRHVRNHNYIFWLSIEDIIHPYEEQLATIATALQLRPPKEPSDQDPLIQPENEPSDEELFVNWLHPREDWLLIIDGYKTKNIGTFLSLNGKCIITLGMGTRRRGHEDSRRHGFSYQEIEVGSMDEGSAIKLMKKYAPRASSESFSQQDALRKVVVELGCMPIALRYASLYINEHHCTFKDYLQVYKATSQMYALSDIKLDPKRFKPLDHLQEAEVDVIYAWWVYFDSIEKKSPDAARILKHCCMLNPDAIYPEIIENIPNLNLSKDKLIKAIGILINGSLIKGEKKNDDILSLEPHVKNFFQSRLDNETKKNLFINIVQALTTTLEGSLSIPALFRQRSQIYAVQFRACRRFIRSYKINDLWISDFYDAYAHYLIGIAEFQEAEKLLEESYQLRQQLQSRMLIDDSGDEERYKTAMNRRHQAEILYWQGKYKEARGLLEAEVLPILREVLKPNDIELATMYYHLARVSFLDTTSDFTGYYYTAFENIFGNLQGQDLPPNIAINLRKQRGSIFYMRGEYFQSFDHYEEAITIATEAEEETLGLEREALHYEIKVCQARKGRCYLALKDVAQYDEIENQFRLLIATYTKISKCHPEVAQQYRNLGDIYRQKGIYGLPMDCYHEAWKIYETIQAGHPAAQHLETLIKQIPK